MSPGPRIADMNGPPSGPQPAGDDALACFARGDLDAAEAACRRSLRHAPDDAGAWHLLGLVAYRRTQPAQPAPLLRRAVALNPQLGDYYVNLGVVERQLGHAATTLRCIRQALAIDPQHKGARHNLANA